MKNKNPGFFMGVLLGIDQLGNTLFNHRVGRWLWGPYIGQDPDETISSALGKEYKANGNKFIWRHPFAKVVGPILNKLDRRHCTDAIEEDEGIPEKKQNVEFK